LDGDGTLMGARALPARDPSLSGMISVELSTREACNIRHRNDVPARPDRRRALASKNGIVAS